MYKRETIKNDLASLGVMKGDILFVRISYKAIGKVEGGPDAVIDAILDVIGEEGTLIATAFQNLIPSNRKNRYKNHIYTPGENIITGVIPTLMAKRNNAFFSLNPVTPYVAIGKDAKTITELHTPHSDGYYIVKYIIDNYHPKCLRIGGDVLDGTTHVAFTEGLKETNNYQRRIPEGRYFIDIDGKVHWCERVSSAFCHEGFKHFFNSYILGNKKAVLAEGLIGAGKAMITDMRETYKIEVEHIKTSPEILSCMNPNCPTCRASFSYSKPGPLIFLLAQLCKLILKSNKQGTLYNIKQALIILNGKRCQ